jgi:hypothetical protein
MGQRGWLEVPYLLRRWREDEQDENGDSFCERTTL